MFQKMTQALTKYETYESDYHALNRATNDTTPAWLRDLREAAFKRFLELGFPTARKGNEPWKYTNVAPIARENFLYRLGSTEDSLSLSEIQAAVPVFESWTNIIFVDGRYSPALSNLAHEDGVEVINLVDAIQSHGDTLEAHLAKYAPFEEDGFVALNTAFINDGAFVRIGENAKPNVTLNIAFVSTGAHELGVTHPRVLIAAEPDSKVTVVESYVGLSENRYFTNAVTEIVLAERAEVVHYRLLNESNAAFHIGTQRVYQNDGSSFTSHAFYKSAGLGRHDLYDLLAGENCSCELNGLYVTTGTQHIDNYINIDHTKPHGTSRLTYKGILDDKSRAVFGGTVWVREGAMKTDSIQTDKNLVLSPDAEVDSKPALFIFADDVKCAHGATAGNIDQDTVFYMRSRGIDLESASRLLIYGFASEIIDKVQEKQLHDHVESLFLDSLPTYKFEF